MTKHILENVHSTSTNTPREYLFVSRDSSFMITKLYWSQITAVKDKFVRRYSYIIRGEFERPHFICELELKMLSKGITKTPTLDHSGKTTQPHKMFIIFVVILSSIEHPHTKASQWYTESLNIVQKDSGYDICT
uniref:Uncharacterized protein n=1 Tax=Trichobilharzia regenti TaxID=157069 RepID=A0AA85JL30_TRIRE|nr:unnamed protein product [Trichobilharzia regenti]